MKKQRSMYESSIFKISVEDRVVTPFGRSTPSQKPVKWVDLKFFSPIFLFADGTVWNRVKQIEVPSEVKGSPIVKVCSDYDEGELVYLLEDHSLVDVSSRPLKTTVYTNPSDPFVDVICGGSFVIAITQNRRLYGYGANPYVMLSDQNLKPIFTDLPPVDYVACGWDNLYVVCNDRTELQVIGRNLDHSLGIPGYANVTSMTRVDLPLLAGERILKIVNTDESVLILLSSQDVLYNSAARFQRIVSSCGPFADIGVMRRQLLFLNYRGELFTAKYPLTDQTLTKLQFPQRPSKRSLLSLTLISGERVALIHAKQRIYELGYQLHSAMKRSELADVSIDFQ